MNIFPTLEGKWTKIDLDEQSHKCDLDFSVPSVCWDWIESLGRARRIDHFYGGFLEDRTYL